MKYEKTTLLLSIFLATFTFFDFGGMDNYFYLIIIPLFSLIFYIFLEKINIEKLFIKSITIFIDVFFREEKKKLNSISFREICFFPLLFLVGTSTIIYLIMTYLVVKDVSMLGNSIDYIAISEEIKNISTPILYSVYSLLLIIFQSYNLIKKENESPIASISSSFFVVLYFFIFIYVIKFLIVFIMGVLF